MGRGFLKKPFFLTVQLVLDALGEGVKETHYLAYDPEEGWSWVQVRDCQDQDCMLWDNALVPGKDLSAVLV